MHHKVSIQIAAICHHPFIHRVFQSGFVAMLSNHPQKYSQSTLLQCIIIHKLPWILLRW
jgi:hypothetical protein